MPRMISTSGILSTGEKKCRPMKSFGRSTPPASSLIGSVEVFEHSSASSLTCSRISANTLFFRLGSSKTASMTRSQPLRSAGLSVGVIRPSMSSDFSAVSLPRETAFSLSLTE